jgi:transcriptional regulator with XRE-family HTH domain
MYEVLGTVIRERREQLGMEQGELAARLGVGQQAVSAWERGRSRPRRTMLRATADALQLDEELLIDVGAYRAPQDAIRLPARPLARSLPIDELPPDRFEDLVTELAKTLHPDGHATRFGGPGEKQFGIDVLVAGEVRNLATAQCKRHKQFGPAAVDAAVRKVTIAADKHYLFLSRLTATPAARRAVAKHSGWELWDGEDISRYIRTQLPPDHALRLVDAYFPGHREAFLGVSRPAPWLPVEEVFLPTAGQIFTHDWDLVGRSDEIARLTEAVYGSNKSLAVLIGRGGMGKTRLLRAVAEAAPHAGTHVRILQSGVPVGPADFELLPPDALVVLIDDAHERDDIAYLLAGIWRRCPDAHILLATRPYGWDRLQTALARAGLLPDDVASVELGDLKLSAAEDLAKEAMGRADGNVVRRLARLTLDCPLATVVGGVLIRRGQLDVAQLENDDEVRDAIMRGFREALVADPEVVDRDTRSAVLDAVAALQPFRTNDDGFRNALSALAGKPFDVLSKHLRSLEDAGILRRRDASLRIVPDLLGDVILAQACYDERSNADTGYLNRVRNLATGQVLQQLFVNVSRVDWQVKRRHIDSPSLVESLWMPLEEEIKEADTYDREQLVKLLTRVAYFQPERVLAVARWLIDNPTDRLSSEHAVWGSFYRPTYRDVLNAIPPMLKGAAYTFELLPKALDLLWELAITDERSTNQFPDHALRVLRDLAEFELGKPAEYNAAIVDAATEWFANDQETSPFSVLEPMLATEGSRQTYQDFTITFQPFSLNVAAVTPLRDRVISLALSEAKCGDVRRAVAGVHILESALRYPSGMYGRPVSDDERDQWTPGFVSTIERLGEVVASACDPAVIVAIRKALHWHSSYSGTATRPVAESTVEGLPDDLEHRVALIIHDGWGHLMRDRDDDFEVAQQKIEQRLADAVTDLCTLDDEAIVRLLSRRLSVERTAFGPTAGHPAPLVAELVRARPSLAPMLTDLIVSGDAAGLESLLPVVVATYAELDAPAALVRARQLLTTDSPEVTRGVAQALGWNRGMRPLAQGERDLVLALAKHADSYVRQQAAFVAQRVANEAPADAARIIAAIDFSDSPKLAGEVFTCFSAPHYGLAWEALTKAQVASVRRRLVAVPEIDEYWVTAFLANLSVRDPAWVIELLQDRVSHAEGLKTLGGYQPLPFNWDNRLRVREHPDFVLHLRRLHAWIAAEPDSWVRQEMGAEIFQEVAVSYDQAVRAVLQEALASTDERDIRAVAAMLRKAHRTIIWDSPEFVSSSLRAAARFGDDCRKAVASGFWGATISGGRMGAPGQPFREDIEQRDRSTDVAKSFPRGSIEEQFYVAMAASAEQSISRSVVEDRATDGRDW